MPLYKLLQMEECVYPRLSQKMQTLDIVLEKAYAQSGKRKKSVLKRIPLHKLFWGTKHKHALASIQESLISAVKMALANPEKVAYVYTDASEQLWAAIVTQTKEEHLRKPIEQQRHEPLAFLGVSTMEHNEIERLTIKRHTQWFRHSIN